MMSSLSRARAMRQRCGRLPEASSGGRLAIALPSGVPLAYAGALRRKAGHTDGCGNPAGDGGRGGHAPRPLVQAARADALPVASEQDRAHRPGPGRRRAGEDGDAARQRAERAGAAAQSRRGSAARGACRVGRRRRARPARHDPVRGPRPARLEQAVRPRRAGRLRHQAPHRRHARLAAERARRPSVARAPARPRHLRGAARGAHAKDGGGPRRDLPLAPGAQDLLGAGRGHPQAAAGAHLALSRQGRGHGRRPRPAPRGGRLRRAREDAGGQARRGGCAAFRHLLRDDRTGAPRASPGCR